MPKYFIIWQRKSQVKKLPALLQKFSGMEGPVKQARLQPVALYLKEKRSVASKSEGVLAHPFFFLTENHLINVSNERKKGIFKY